MIQKQILLIKSYFLLIATFFIFWGFFFLYHFLHSHQESCGGIVVDRKTIFFLLFSGLMYGLTTAGLFLKQNIARQIGMFLAASSLCLTPLFFVAFQNLSSQSLFVKYAIALGILLFFAFLPVGILYCLQRENIKSLFLPIPEKFKLPLPFFMNSIREKYSFVLICLSIYFFVLMALNIFSLPEMFYKEIFIFGRPLTSWSAIIYTQGMIILGFIAAAGLYQQAKLAWWAGLGFNLVTFIGLLLNMIFITPEQIEVMSGYLMFLKPELRNAHRLINPYQVQMAWQLLVPGLLSIYLLMKKNMFMNTFIEWKKK